MITRFVKYEGTSHKDTRFDITMLLLQCLASLFAALLLSRGSYLSSTPQQEGPALIKN